MKTHKFRSDNINLLIFLVMILSLLTLGANTDVKSNKSNIVTSMIIGKVIRPNDIVFVDAEVDLFVQEAIKTNATVLPFTTYKNFESQFEGWLDNACKHQVPEDVKTYFVWGKSNGNRFVELSSIFRMIFFFASFEGVDSAQTDQFFLIQLRQEKLENYCKAKEFLENTKTNSLTLIVDSSLFSPLSGVFTIGRLTWLPSDPLINISYGKLLVKNWDRQFYLIDRVDVWDYSEKEYFEYKIQTSKMNNNSWIVVNQDLRLGTLPNTFFILCGLERQTTAQRFGYKALCVK